MLFDSKINSELKFSSFFKIKIIKLSICYLFVSGNIKFRYLLEYKKYI